LAVQLPLAAATVSLTHAPYLVATAFAVVGLMVARYIACDLLVFRRRGSSRA
jgi:putative flippase GtrA